MSLEETKFLLLGFEPRLTESEPVVITNYTIEDAQRGKIYFTISSNFFYGVTLHNDVFSYLMSKGVSGSDMIESLTTV